MRVMVTGIAGFLGSRLAQALLDKGHKVVGVDSLIGGYEDNVPVGAWWQRGDCCDFDLMKHMMRGVDVVYHAAASAHEGLSVFSPAENAHNGYAASASVFSAACAMRVKRIIFMSSMARYGEGGGQVPFTEETPALPEDPYGQGKLAAEGLLRVLAEEHGVEWTVVVPHNIAGAGQVYDDPFRNALSIFANLMLQGERPTIYGDGSQERAFSSWRDVVDPLIAMLDSPRVVGEIINVGPDKEVVTILDAARVVYDAVKALGHSPSLRFDPIFKPGRPREVKLAHCSADKARRLLGYEPRVSLFEIVTELVAWIAKRGVLPFRYTLKIEIDGPRLPETWGQRLF